MSTLAHTRARINPDRPFVGAIVVILVLVVMAFAMSFSFTALTEAGAWTHNPQWTWWLVAGFIDGPILVYTASYAIWRWRAQARYAGHSMRTLIFFTGLSVVVNALHVASGAGWDWGSPEMYGGIAIAAAAPIGALLAAHEVTRLVFMHHGEDDVAVVALADSAVQAPETAEESQASPTGGQIEDVPVFEDEDELRAQASAAFEYSGSEPYDEADDGDFEAEVEVEPEVEPDTLVRQRPESSLLVGAGDLA